MTLGQAGRRGASVAWGRWHRGTIPARKESPGSSPGRRGLRHRCQTPPRHLRSEPAVRRLPWLAKYKRQFGLLPSSQPIAGRPAWQQRAPWWKGKYTRPEPDSGRGHTAPCALQKLLVSLLQAEPVATGKPSPAKGRSRVLWLTKTRCTAMTVKSKRRTTEWMALAASLMGLPCLLFLPPLAGPH